MDPLQENNRFILLLLLFLLMSSLGTVAWLWRTNQQYQVEADQLQLRLDEANLAKKEAIITRRVSQQLEEIAYQQKELSDQQRKEAVRQTELAEEMRVKAEQEREKALVAQQSALIAFEEMATQKQLAEQRQREAEVAKREADTLAYQALAKQLNEQALSIHQNLVRGTYSSDRAAYWREIISMMAYTSWKIAKQYGGNWYVPLEMLLQYSQLTRAWHQHRGAIRALLVDSSAVHPYQVITCSDYGEIIRWAPTSDYDLMPTPLFQDSTFDFRCLQLDAQRQTLYALSVDGRLVIWHDGAVEVVPTRLTRPVGMAILDDQLYIATQQAVYHTAIDALHWQELYASETPITCFQPSGGALWIGSEQDRIMRLTPAGQVVRMEGKPVEQADAVTAIYWDPSRQLLAYGRQNGSVVLRSDEQNMAYNRPIPASASRISAVRLMGPHLVLSSFEGLLLHWEMGMDQSSSALDQVKGWIYCLDLSPDQKLFYYGDQQGGLHQVAYQPDVMAAEIHARLTRNFTPEEWGQYIGKGYPYEQTIIP